jgi:opacity protein-like surface antigen
MRTNPKYVLVILFTVCIANLNGQIKSGYVVGVNMSTLVLQTKGICSNLETKEGINLGLFLDVPLSRRFSFHPKLMFSAKGTDYKIDSVQYSLSPVYIEIPLNLGFRIGSISLFAGPYFACGIGGLKMDRKGNLKDISFGSGENKDMKQLDAGLNFGLGVNIKGFLISAQYGIGLANVSPDATIYSEMKNRVFAISICRYGGDN